MGVRVARFALLARVFLRTAGSRRFARSRLLTTAQSAVPPIRTCRANADMRGSLAEARRQASKGGLLRFLMPRVLAAEAAILIELEPLGRLLLVLRRAVIAALTFVARQRDDVSHR